MDHLPSCQLHISVNRTAQIYLELHFCVELHTKKALTKCIILAINNRNFTFHKVVQRHYLGGVENTHTVLWQIYSG